MTPEERREREFRLMGREQREGEEEASAELDAARRSLADACLDLGSSGVEVIVDTIAGPRRGRIVHVGADLLTVASNDGQRVDVALAQILGVSSDRQIGRAATVSTGHPGSMVARLRELLQSESVAMLQRMDGTTITGVVRAVAADHVELVAGSSQSIIPISAVVAISA